MLSKRDIELALHEEHQEISKGFLKEDNPLDESGAFRTLCEACRRGDLKTCQEKLQEGVNINARDRFDYTPLILASLCGHFEVVQFLLDSGALCERDTFQGERCLYNALNDRIRNLLLSYDYSKSRDPLQPLAGHITSILYRDSPHTSDITITTETTSFKLHKFVLAARSPYFAKKLAAAPDTTSWKVPAAIPNRAMEIAIIGVYFGEISVDFGTSEDDQNILTGIERLSQKLEMGHIFEDLLVKDRRLARQRRSQEIERGQQQMDSWFRSNVLQYQVCIDREKVDDIKWDRQNNIFADVLLCADDPEGDEDEVDDIHVGHENGNKTPLSRSTRGPLNGIPVGPLAPSTPQRSPSPTRKQSTIFPAHRAMLLRSEYFNAMFCSPFREAQHSEHLPVIHVDCSAAVLTVILTYLYTETTDFGLDIALDVLFTADQLFIEKLKVKAAMIISTLGNGDASIVESANPRGETNVEDAIDVYDVLRAGWDTRVHRLEEFAARYIAYRLERFVDREDFKDLVRESAARIQKRQETDTVELIDDIRYYLSERFRLRFEEVGFDEIEDDGAQVESELSKVPAQTSQDEKNTTASQANHHIEPTEATVIRTLDGEIAGDEFAQDAQNYQILLGKIDHLLDSLKLDA